MKIDEQWECWTLCPRKIEGTYRGREGTTAAELWPRLVQKIAEGKTSYELSWKVKVMIKTYIRYVVREDRPNGPSISVQNGHTCNVHMVLANAGIPGTRHRHTKSQTMLKIGQGRCRNNVQKNFLALGYFSRFLWAGPCCTARVSFGSYIFDNC